MQDLAELERRINAALQRIAAGVEGQGSPAPTDSPDIDTLRADLASERAQNAALRQQLASAPAPAAATPADADARVEQLTRQIDIQGLEMQRMRKNVVQLRENLRALRRAAAEKVTDPDLINRAMLAELESIRVTRFAEMAELDEIIAELDPLIAPLAPEVSEHA